MADAGAYEYGAATTGAGGGGGAPPPPPTGGQDAGAYEYLLLVAEGSADTGAYEYVALDVPTDPGPPPPPPPPPAPGSAPPAAPAPASFPDTAPGILPLWTFELVRLDGTPLAEIQPADPTVTFALSGAGGASMTFTLDTAPAPLDTGAVDLLVSRGRRRVFRGQLLGDQVELDATSGRVTFNALGLLEVLADRYIPAGREVLATEATQIAWGLIADTQAVPLGDLGILQGQLVDTVARSKTWESLTPIRQAIEELAGLDPGFDFAIEPDPDTGVYVFSTYAPRGVRSPVVLEWGRNIRKVSATRDLSAGRLTNHAVAVGQNQVQVTASDTGSAQGYRLREAAVFSGEADDATVLGDLARAQLRRSAPRYFPRLELIPGAPDATLDDIGLGDVVEVSVRRGWLRLTGDYRVETIEARPLPGGGERLAVTVSPT